jgi:hypothetical protein
MYEKVKKQRLAVSPLNLFMEFPFPLSPFPFPPLFKPLNRLLLRITLSLLILKYDHAQYH